MAFETYHDAKLVMDVLGKRLGRFGLKLHPDKTCFIDFRPQRHGGTPPDCKAQSFDFLGFTHSWGKSRKGKNVVRQTTAKSRYAGSLVAVKASRHRPAREQRAWLSTLLVRHYAYNGITGNIRRLQAYRYQVVRIWHKWLKPRTRGRLLVWANFSAFLARHPLPWPGSSTATPAGMNLSREEPDAGNPFVRGLWGQAGNALAYPAEDELP